MLFAWRPSMLTTWLKKWDHGYTAIFTILPLLLNKRWCLDRCSRHSFCSPPPVILTSSLANDGSLYMECITPAQYTHPSFCLTLKAKFSVAHGNKKSATCLMSQPVPCKTHTLVIPAFAHSKRCIREWTDTDTGLTIAASCLDSLDRLLCHCNSMPSFLITMDIAPTDLQMENEAGQSILFSSWIAYNITNGPCQRVRIYLVYSHKHKHTVDTWRHSSPMVEKDASRLFFQTTCCGTEFSVPQDPPQQPWRHGHYLALKDSTNVMTLNSL